jgi:hypothetical protein
VGSVFAVVARFTPGSFRGSVVKYGVTFES